VRVSPWRVTGLERFRFDRIRRFRTDFLRDEKQAEYNGSCQYKQDEQREIGMIHELVANKKKPYRPIERYGLRTGDTGDLNFF
jgi:hypothetical protein